MKFVGYRVAKVAGFKRTIFLTVLQNRKKTIAVDNRGNVYRNLSFFRMKDVEEKFKDQNNKNEKN